MNHNLTNDFDTNKDNRKKALKVLNQLKSKLREKNLQKMRVNGVLLEFTENNPRKEQLIEYLKEKQSLV